MKELMDNFIFCAMILYQMLISKEENTYFI